MLNYEKLNFLMAILGPKSQIKFLKIIYLWIFITFSMKTKIRFRGSKYHRNMKKIFSKFS